MYDTLYLHDFIVNGPFTEHKINTNGIKTKYFLK